MADQATQGKDETSKPDPAIPPLGEPTQAQAPAPASPVAEAAPEPPEDQQPPSEAEIEEMAARGYAWIDHAWRPQSRIIPVV
jgi:hypothetical protein